MERDRDRPPKLQSAIYYALDGDQVHILTMLAQRSGDPWVCISELTSLIINNCFSNIQTFFILYHLLT